MYLTRFLISLSLCSLFLAGCDNAPRPANFPRLVPYALTVLNGNQPESDVNVFFAPEGTVAAGSGGNTDSNGKAVVHTSQGTYSKKGIPVGQYTVVLNKTPVVPGAKPRSELSKMDVDELEAYTREQVAKERALPKIIPEALTSSSTSPIKIAVESSGGEMTIDLTDYKK